MPRHVDLLSNPLAFCDVWAKIPASHYIPPIPGQLLGNAVIIPGAEASDGVQVTFKLLSVDPANYDDAPSEGLRRLLQIIHRKPIPRGHQYDSSVFGTLLSHYSMDSQY
jgi:5-oxoprolinase (ATP-hydrolysing)